MAFYNNVIAGAAGAGGAAAAGYKIERSLRFNRSDSAYLSKSPTGGNRKKWTLSFWYKPCLGTGNARHCIIEVRNGSNHHSVINFRNDHKFEIYHYTTSLQFQVLTTAVFRDPSAWYHFVVAYDTDQSGADKVKIFCNGIRITQFDAASYPSDSYGEALWSDNNTPHTIGKHGTQYLNGYLAEYHWLDGLAPGVSTDDANGSVTGTPNAQYLTDFGEFSSTTGVWNPIEYTGSHGTQGYYLDFSDNSSNAALGTDSSGNNNTWTVNNLIAAQLSPTITTGGDPTSSTNSPFSTGDRYSVAFDGNDKLTMPGPGVVSGDYTMECFVKASSYSGIQRFFSANEGVNAGESTMLRAYQGDHEFYHKGGVSDNGTTIPTNQWNHVAITRSGSTVSYYMNGSRLGTDTNSDAITITTLVVAHGYGSEYFSGEVSNARFVDGQALYTGSSYTVPTVTLTTTSQGASAGNVRALCCHQNTVTGVEGVLSAKSAIDSLLDSPTNYDASSGNNGGNYCTFNPLDKNSQSTLTNGNLDWNVASGGNGTCRGTIAVSSGKWYFEFEFNSGGGTAFGILDVTESRDFPGGSNAPKGYSYYSEGANFTKKYHDGSNSNYGASFTPGDTIGVALDLDNGTINFYKNGADQGQAYSGVSGTFAPAVAYGSSVGSSSATLNAGQRPFSISSVPTGYKSLCTQNLEPPLIADGSDHFDTKTFTGNGHGQSIGGTLYSNLLTAPNGFLSSEPATNAFNGDETSRAKASTADDVVTFDLSSLNLTGSFEFWVTNASSQYSIDGGSTYTNSTSNNWTTVTDISGVSNIKLKPSSGTTLKVTAFRNQGKHLLNSNGESYEFSPDLIWVKSRTNPSAGHYHHLHDTVRGLSNGFYSNLYSNTIEEENKYAASVYGGISEIISDGFILRKGTDNTHPSSLNYNSIPYVAWAWNGGNLATNSAYNQSEVWSSNVSSYLNALGSEPVTNLFDGDTSTSFYSSNTSGSGIKFVPTTAITGSIELYLRNGDTANTTISYSLDNGSTFTNLTTTAGNGSYVSIGNQTISNTNGIIVRHVTTAGTNSVNWRAIKVDNKVLVDPGVIPVGGLNSSVYNQSQVWSNDLASDNGNYFGTHTPAKAFDGDLTTKCTSSTAGGTLTLDLSNNNLTGTLQVYAYTGMNVAVTHSGGTTTIAGGTSPTPINFGSLTSISQIVVTGSSSSYNAQLFGIKLNGALLIDSNVSVTNVPSIATTVRANPTAGFSIVTYSQGAAGSVVAHGLNKQPGMIIAKTRTLNNQPWVVYHSALGKGGVLQLHETAGNNTTYPTYWGSNEPDSYVFGVYTGSAPWANNAGNMVAYCFTSIEGYSSVSSFTSASGNNFIYTGFRPAFLICKKVVNSTDSSYEGWIMFDSERGPYNINQVSLYANTNYVDGKRGNDGTVSGSTFGVDFLSNGFAFKDNSTEYNRADSSTYVYYAVAENPFKTARAR